MAKTMRRSKSPHTGGNHKAWSLDQLTKSEFFHQKLHAWGLLTVALEVERIKGETLKWDLEPLGISNAAWDKVVHRGIKPILVFVHPDVLGRVSRSVSYYRMLSMVSRKSMIRVRLPLDRYEDGEAVPSPKVAQGIARHLNRIISHLVELDDAIDVREFDLWRGMAAGSQAQGSWQNVKGEHAEVVARGIFQRRLREKQRVSSEEKGGSTVRLGDGRVVLFADDPDIAIYRDEKILAAVEIKGGIDAAGVLERLGAAIKSLRRVKRANPSAATILILQEVSMTRQAKRDLAINRSVVGRWFTIEDVLGQESKREEVFRLLSI